MKNKFGACNGLTSSHVDIESVINHLPQELPSPGTIKESPQGKNEINVLYVGYRHIRPLLAIAQARPDITFTGFDQHWDQVKKAREATQVCGVDNNVRYLTLSFVALLSRHRDDPFDAVLYMPPLVDNRLYRAINTSRMRSVADCYDLVSLGGRLIVQAAMTEANYANELIGGSTLNLLRDGYVRAGLLTDFLEDEISLLQGGTLGDLSRFLLTHAKHVCKLPYADQVRSVGQSDIDDDDEVPEGENRVPASDAVMPSWKNRYVMDIGRCRSIVEDTGLTVIECRTFVPEALASYWSSAFDFSDEVIQKLAVSGLIVAIKE